MKEHYGIAIDIGTSGIRAQALDLSNSNIISTAITLRHPLPGANIMDHLHFSLEVGRETSHVLILDTINRLIEKLDIDLGNVDRVAVCGNPIQLSIFQNIEITDLAYWGKHALDRLGITPPSRNATVKTAEEVELKVNPKAEVYIPPAVKHEIGADALAMIVKADILEKKGVYLVSDFGTNAEIALIINGEVYSCSAAAGPAIEGQEMEKGMLASPGAISDVNPTEDGWKNYVLDETLIAREGDLIDPSTGRVMKQGEMHEKALGITGTGAIAILSLGLKSGLISPPKIKTSNKRICLQDSIYFTEKDLLEVGKALGAFRAGYITLAEEGGILLEDIDAVYMAGASGFYVDPHKSLEVGQIPASSREIYQIGNTSLALARDLVLDPGLLDKLQEIANGMRGKHIMLATSKIFENVYPLELSMWEQGMPLWMYNEWLRKYGYQPLPHKCSNPKIYKLFESDIPVLGKKGLKITKDIGSVLRTEFEGCTGCETCINNCPEGALMMEDSREMVLRTDLCNGMGCLRCEFSCPEKVFKFKQFLSQKI